MVNSFIEQLKLVIKGNESAFEKLIQITHIENFYCLFISGFFLTIGFNYGVYLFYKNIHHFSKSDNQYENDDRTRSKNLIWVSLYFFSLTIISYIKIIPHFFTKIFAASGDSYNHYARLVESKRILLDPDASIFHWPGIFFPDGLTAFDGPPTLYNDLIHLMLEPLIGSIGVYNLIHMSTFILAGVFSYMLALEITKSKESALFTSTLYAFSSYHVFSSNLWLNITHIELFPLIIWAYIKANKSKNSKKFIIISSLAMTVLGYQSLYFTFMTYIIIAIFYISPNLKNLKKLIINSISIIISILFLSFWLIPMLKDPSMGKQHYMPHMYFNLDLFRAFVGSKAYLFNDYKVYSPFIGLPILILAILSLIKKLNTKYINYGFITLLILSMGSLLKFNNELLPIIGPEIILTFLPALKSIRSTDRYIIFLMIPLAIMAYNAIFYFIKKRAIRISFLIILVMINFPLHQDTIDVSAPEIYSKIPIPPKKDFGILELPLNYQSYWMWRAEHQYEIVYGYLFIRGKKDKLFHQLHQNIMNNEKINLDDLKKRNIKFIISHNGWYENLYAKTFGYPSRLNKKYNGLTSYFSKQDIGKIKFIESIGNSYLYQIE